VVGDSGRILKTTDGGIAWNSLASGTTRKIAAVHFPQNALTGYVVGDGGTVLKTTDGGGNWIRQNPDTISPFKSVHFPVDAQTGYLLDWRGIILKTSDGGQTWRNQFSSGTVLRSLYFPIDASTGYAVGHYGTILKTTDGGTSFVEDQRSVRPLDGLTVGRLKIIPNPFVSFATVLGHEAERFALYDISGRRVGTYKGEQIGMDLWPGVYFIRSLDRKAGLGRIVKVR